MIKNELYFLLHLLLILQGWFTKKYATVIFLLISLIQVHAQVGQKINVEDKFDTYRQHHLQEKIFVHTDKKNYVTGEICWFKIYNTDAYFHRLINLSKVAYVEILNSNNQPVLQAKTALDKGTGSGSFYLPASIASGNYRLRTYTNWMKNEGAEYFFEKNLCIVNAEKNLQKNTTEKKPAYEIVFFPEGGNLVNGIESKVGFKINNQFGNGVNFEGFLVNDKGDTLTTFHPLKFGMGSFSFTPAEGVTYKALIKFPGGEQQQMQLPAAYNTGYVMHLEKTNESQVKVTVTMPEKNNPESLFLFVHTRNVIKTAISHTTENGKATFIVDNTKPGDGISHFTVFNEKGQPVCERLYFKKPLQTLQISAVTDQQLYSQRKKIAVAVSSSTEEGKAIPANMSMAVYRVDSFNIIDEDVISNYLLLTSDLSGTVESPGYYFSGDNDTVNTALDNLLLTQGWRRFKWENILSNKESTVKFLPEINGHIVAGKITSLLPGSSVEYVQTYLSAPGTRTQFQNATSDKDGKLTFEMKNFYTDGQLIVQTNHNIDSTYKLNIDPPFFHGYSSKQMQPFYFSGRENALLKTYVSTQVQNSFLYDKLNQSAMELTDTGAFYIKPDAVYLLDNYVRFTTVEEVLREYVPDVLVRSHAGKFDLPVFDIGARIVMDDNPLVLLDGVPVFNFNKLMLFDALKIKKLEVVARKYILGGNLFSGIVNFITYKGDMSGFETDPHAAVIDYEGLQLRRDFYSPVYDTPEKSLNRLPDFRSLLYWSADVITTGNGKTTTTFYSSDLPGRYAAIIQGLSDDGRAGATIVYFDVNNP